MSRGAVSKDIFDAIVATTLEPHLAGHGFARYHNDWFFSWQGEQVRRITAHFQRDPIEDVGKLSFTFAAGIKSLSEFLKTCVPVTVEGSRPTNKRCFVACASWNIETDGCSREWMFSDSSELLQISAEVVHFIDAFGIPFLNRFRTVNDLVQHWEQLQKDGRLLFFDLLCLAGAYGLLNESTKAKNMLNDYLNEARQAFQRTMRRADKVEIEKTEDVLRWLEAKRGQV